MKMGGYHGDDCSFQIIFNPLNEFSCTVVGGGGIKYYSFISIGDDHAITGDTIVVIQVKEGNMPVDVFIEFLDDEFVGGI
jgi:hypothetical protein